jgi:RHS repeat-associated protein
VGKTLPDDTVKYVNSLNGQVLSVFGDDGTWRYDLVYLDGRPIGKVVNGQSVEVLYFITDHLGTPVAITDNSRTVVWSSEYYPFGEQYAEYVSETNKIRFPGQWHDQESGLHYNWHRYYATDIGRYLQADPIGLAGGMNPYGYALNNPLSYTDLEGLSVWDDIVDGYWTAFYVSNPTLWAGDQVSSYLVSLLPAWVREGRYVGTGYGEEAVEYWACKYNNEQGEWYTNQRKFAFGLAGNFAALWTEDNWKWTSLTLSGAYTWRVIGPYSTRGVPKYIQRIRKFMRFDRPHHGKPYGWDGEWFK